MCARVRFAAGVVATWDPSSRTITVPAMLSPERTLIAVRAVLTELGVEQPELGALCYCGAPVYVVTERIPNQPGEVINIGA